MKITFIQPSVGKKKATAYSRSWIMEPISLAVLAALTPKNISRVLYDDRLEEVLFDEPTDLVALSVETYTAKRAYQIAAQYKKRNVTVVMGGYHPTLVPKEALEHADAIVIGEGEIVWGILLQDFQSGNLQKTYKAQTPSSLEGVFPDRSLFKGKNYFNITLIETGRGCRFGCEFCSINAFYQKSYTSRPVADVVAEIIAVGTKNIFFVDDNIANDRVRAHELFSALIPLKINWFSQVSMHIYKDDELLDLMRRSGCRGVLIGFETVLPENLRSMGKDVNSVSGGFDSVVKSFHRHSLAIYATFVFGYNDTEETFRETYRFALRNKIFYTAFNHLVPFPGTQLYNRLQARGKMLYTNWWTDDRCHFGNVYFDPENITPGELERLCYKYRFKFFRFPSLVYRLLHLRLYWSRISTLLFYLGVNVSANRETRRRQMLPFGVDNE